tara:strand:+ start:94 stop:633 length:540 start_codon:yes stop_codon:yes gene_type:complete
MNFLEKLKDKRGVELSLEWSDESRPNYDYEVGSESTADGYEIYYVKESSQEYELQENVYYYESGALEKIYELMMEEEDITIHFWEEDMFDNIDLDDIESELADELWDFSDEDEISESWAELYLESIIETEREQSGGIDEVMRNESFHAYTDELCKEGSISEEFYNSVSLTDEYLEMENI